MGKFSERVRDQGQEQEQGQGQGQMVWASVAVLMGLELRE